MRGADLLVGSLAAAGVSKIFSLSGNQIMPVYDACIGSSIEIVHTRHEAAAVFMADAWAQLTGEIGVALVTAGPGLLNALGALYTARRSESPVLLLSGDSPRAQDGMGAFQEVDQIAFCTLLTKLSRRLNSGADLGAEVSHAIRIGLSGRPGPVHIAMPFDLLSEQVGDVALRDQPVFRPEPQILPARDLTMIATVIAKAERPLIVLGPALNATRFGTGISALPIALDAPVVVIESPRGMNDPSLGDIARVFASADLILGLGRSIDVALGSGTLTNASCRWLIVDAEPAEHARAVLNLGERLLAAISGNPRDIALALMEKSGRTEQRLGWRRTVEHLISLRTQSASAEASAGKIAPADVCAAVQRQILRVAQSVVICDGGEFGQWSQAGTTGTYRLINGPSGAIGGGLCYAVAASLAKPGATVFALMGDGSVGFHLAEFETAARTGARFVAVIGNDQRWNAEHQIQLRDYGPERLMGCSLSGARYDKAVEALGGHGEYVEDLTELDAALRRAVDSGKAACVNVCIEGRPAPSGAGL